MKSDPCSTRPSPAVPRASDSYAESFEHRIRVGIDLDGLQAPGDHVRGLQAVARDEEDDAVVRAELAAVDGRPQGSEGDPGGGLAEDARRLGEEHHVRADLFLGDGVDRTAGRLRGGDGEVAVGGAADRERAGNGVRPY